MPIFVAVLGASNYTYAEATADLTRESWIGAHIRALEYCGGVPQILVCDNTRSAVRKADRYEPDLNRAFADMAAHHGTAIIPARVRKSRDKAKAEAGVLVVERWIVAALPGTLWVRTFFSLQELNAAIRALLEQLNARQCRPPGRQPPRVVREARPARPEALAGPALRVPGVEDRQGRH